MIKILPTLIITSAIIAVSFVFMPILRASAFDNIFFIKLKSLSAAKDYFNIISNVVSSLGTFVGIYLGYVYFNSKNELDRKSKIIEKKSREYNYILTLIKEYETIFLKCIREKKPGDTGDHLLSDLKICYNEVYDILEADVNFFGLSESELSIFLELHSYVENLFDHAPSSPTSEEAEEIIEDFRKRAFSVKQLCWTKSHEVG